MKNRTKLIRAVPALLAGLTLLLAVACGNVGGSGESDSGSGPTIVVGSKNFTEQYILGNMYAQALEANGFDARDEAGPGLRADRGQGATGRPDRPLPRVHGHGARGHRSLRRKPRRSEHAERDLRGCQEGLRRSQSCRHDADAGAVQQHLRHLRPQVGCRGGGHHEPGAALQGFSKNLTFISYSEFQNRSDGYPNVKKNYPAFDFKEIEIVNQLGLRYSGLESGDGDVGVGFTTDGQLTSPQLVVMKDPKSIWPFYYPAPVVRSDVLKKYPKIEGILNEVSASLDVEKMRELNAQVDLDQEDPEDVAAEYLEKEGIVKN